MTHLIKGELIKKGMFWLGLGVVSSSLLEGEVCLSVSFLLSVSAVKSAL